MTQPNPGDYVALEPKTSTPNASTPGAARGDDNGIAVHGTSVVQMQEQAWLRRAEAATAAAEELMVCRRKVTAVLTRNYFGDGCPEGTAVYSALQEFTANWNEQLSSQVKTLQSLASQCQISAASLSATDRVSSAHFSLGT